ncbi:hypothetical protein F4678DRAFT_64223 [Xylaria arbuscula]|nr:hypothetical protein F4678DRAFT_64223 [Xylaria arbuscula]
MLYKLDIERKPSWKNDGTGTTDTSLTVVWHHVGACFPYNSSEGEETKNPKPNPTQPPTKNPKNQKKKILLVFTAREAFNAIGGRATLASVTLSCVSLLSHISRFCFFAPLLFLFSFFLSLPSPLCRTRCKRASSYAARTCTTSFLSCSPSPFEQRDE